MNLIAISLIIIVVLFAMLMSAFEDKKEYCEIIQMQEEQIEEYEKIIFDKEGEL